MGTVENRTRYNRDHLRYPSDLTDEERGLIEPLLPPGNSGRFSPDSHRIKLRTDNPLERIMREIRRRTRVIGAFPDGQSCLNLAAADCGTSQAHSGWPANP